MVDERAQHTRRDVERRGRATNDREVDKTRDVAGIRLLGTRCGSALEREVIEESLEQKRAMSRVGFYSFLRRLFAISHATNPTARITAPMTAAVVP